MNKIFFSILPLLFSLSIPAFAQEVVEVPISLIHGYSVFHPSMAATGPEADDNPFKLELKGIPKKLKNIKRHHLILDEKQFFYQSYLSKKISKERFDQLMQQRVKYELNENELSKKPLRASVYVITGEDEKGKKVWLADTDTDLDFSDEKERPLLTYAAPLDFDKYKSFADNAVQIKYQRLLNGKVLEEAFPLAIVRPTEGEYVHYSFPKHYTATVKADNKVYELSIESGGFLSKGLDAQNNSMVVLTGKEKDKTVGLSVPVRPSQFFYLGDEVYQYLGLDAQKRTAKFQRVQDAASIKSAQVGFTAIDFQGKDFASGKELSLGQLRGKYVLLDFWASWCGPCIREFPALKALTAHYDSSKFEVLGIIGASDAGDVAKLLDKHQLTWAQILSDEIVDQYGVVSYPSTFIISPEGKVIYKDLKGEELERVLAELIK